MGTFLTSWRFLYKNSLACFVSVCEKKQVHVHVQMHDEACSFPLAFQLAILQVYDYYVYGLTEGCLCGNYGQKSVLSEHLKQ